MRLTWKSNRHGALTRVRPVRPNRNATRAQFIADACVAWHQQTDQPITDERIVTIMHALKCSTREIKAPMPVRTVRMCLPAHLNVENELPDLDTL